MCQVGKMGYHDGRKQWQPPSQKKHANKYANENATAVADAEPQHHKATGTTGDPGQSETNTNTAPAMACGCAAPATPGYTHTPSRPEASGSSCPAIKSNQETCTSPPPGGSENTTALVRTT